MLGQALALEQARVLGQVPRLGLGQVQVLAPGRAQVPAVVLGLELGPAVVPVLGPQLGRAEELGQGRGLGQGQGQFWGLVQELAQVKGWELWRVPVQEWVLVVGKPQARVLVQPPMVQEPELVISHRRLTFLRGLQQIFNSRNLTSQRGRIFSSSPPK